MHEFARVLQAIIHGAVQFRKLPDPLIIFKGIQDQIKIVKVFGKFFS